MRLLLILIRTLLIVVIFCGIAFGVLLYIQYKNQQSEEQKVTLYDGEILVMNFDQDIYNPGDTVRMQIAGLDKKGNTLCNLEMDLTITPPEGEDIVLSTTMKDGILTNPKCENKTFTTIPDYKAYLEPEIEGNYVFTLTANMPAGPQTISTTLEVSSAPRPRILRRSVSRIYPIDEHQMTIFFIPDKTFRGTVIERLPISFKVDDIYPPAKGDIQGDHRLIIWEDFWAAGVRTELTYKYDAPNKSPVLYKAGPITVEGAIVPSSKDLE